MSRPTLRPARAVALFVVVLLLTAAWLAFRGLQIRNDLLSARQQLEQVSEGLVAGDAATSAAVRADVASALAASRDPLWRLAAAVPVAGGTFAVAADAAEATSVLVEDVLPAAERSAELLRSRPPLVDGRVDLELLRALQPEVEIAAAASARARTAATESAGRRLPGVVERLRADLVEQVSSLDDGLQTADTALALAPGMLGQGQPRRYFIAVMNNAEARGAGGLIGAYVVVRVEDGMITREAVGTNDDFRTAPQPVVDLGPEFSALYDRNLARQAYQSAVLTPHWPSSSKIIAALWEAQGGQPIDAVVGIDPLSMADIMAVTGPVSVDGRSIGAENVVDFVLRDEYAEFQDAPGGERREVLSELAEGIYDGVLSADYGALELLQALAEAGRSGHLQLWSAAPQEQEVLEDTRVGGALSRDPGAYLQVVTNNFAGNKADYYLRRKVGYERSGEGTAEVSVELTNTVDAASVPPIVTGRLDEPSGPVEPGQTKVLLTLYVGVGQEVLSLSVDGERVPFEAGAEQGHGYGAVLVEVAPSAPTTVTATVTDPGGSLVYRQQPLVVDDTLELGVAHEVR